MKCKTLSVALSDEILNKIETMAKSKGLAKSSIVKMALTEFFERNADKEKK